MRGWVPKRVPSIGCLDCGVLFLVLEMCLRWWGKSLRGGGVGGVVLKWRRKIRVHFVLDDWMGVGLLHILIPRVFWIAPNKESSFKNRYVWYGDGVSWEVSVKRAFRQSGSGEFQSLLGLISNAFLCRDVDDSRIWKPNTTGDLSSKSFHRSWTRQTWSFLLALWLGGVLLLLEWRPFAGWL